MNFVIKFFGSLALVVFLVTTVFAQRYAVTSGNWTDPIWASTQSGTPGSAAMPTSTDNIIVNTGITVTVNTSSASCLSINFQDSTGSFALATGSILNVYGDLTVDSMGTAFSSWATGAKLRFTGSNKQFIRGFRVVSNSLDSTVLMEVIVDKSADTLKTLGLDMKIGLGTSFEIVHGVFQLGYKDDFNGRVLGTLASSTPTITIDTGGVFTMYGSTSAIRSGVSGTGRIGKMTIKGTVHMATTSTIGICIGGVEVIAGGTLYMDSFSSTAQNNVHLDSVYVRRSGILYNGSSINFWDSTATMVVTMDTGAVYKVTTQTTNFPRHFNNTGTVRYQRTVGDSSQTIVDMNYYRLEVSFGGSKTWTLGTDRYIYDSLEINNQARFTITASTSANLTVGNVLRLTSGYLINSDPNTTLTLSDGATISRATGTISSAPYFDGGVNIKYTSTVSSVTTGPEIPSSSSTVQDFQVICDSQTVTLASPLTINGTLTLSNGTLNNSSQTLTIANNANIRRATGNVTAPLSWAGIANVAYISSIGSVVTGYELPSATNVLENLQIICDTLAVTLSSPVTINGLLTLSNGIFDNSSAALTLANGASIRRATATLTAAPVFAGTIDLAYISTLATVATGYEVPTASNVLQTLSIESPKNVTLNSGVAVNESLSFSRGVFYLGNNNISLAPGAVIGGTPSDTSMLVTNGTGMLKKQFTATGSMLYPVGDSSGGATHYTPMTLTFNIGTFGSGAFAGVRVTPTKHPLNLSNGDYLNRYWTTTSSGITAYTCDVMSYYRDTDIVGNENNMNVVVWDGANWTWITPVQAATNQLLASGVTSLGDYTGAPASGSYHVVQSWNLISAPFLGPNMLRTHIFPTASSSPFAYADGYVPKDTVVPGYGYWVKFNSAQTIPMLGFPLSVETVNVAKGWNMIGSIATPLYKGNVSPIGTTITSNYYLYNNGYASTETLRVGYGFWIKVSGAGKLVLSSATLDKQTQGINSDNVLKNAAGLRFTDAAGNIQNLYVGTGSELSNTLDMYEMPPLPHFADCTIGFDVRYASNRFAEVAGNKMEQEFPVQITSGNYPVTVVLTKPGSMIGQDVRLKIGNTIVPFTTTKTILIKDGSQAISVIVTSQKVNVPAEFSLSQNYPNPFNPSTAIVVQIAERIPVTLQVFDVLGRVVATLMNKEMEPGSYTVQWDAGGNPSGMYFYKLTAGSFTDVKKLVVMK